MSACTGVVDFGGLEGYSIEADGKKVKEALFGVCSIGKEMGEWATSLFAQGDYLGECSRTPSRTIIYFRWMM
ncbi:hypothetical protein I6E09_05555 [Mediterraneibacter glycyrrhizinilyticus]|uniref:hypothetical protein n=1 Tax=Mediterraneibacter glycyrrhizinilyticus TaxID=342942 RepID=UPI00265A8251|nr:hypothetical protein [Mediterraneibacter glycyrrhizinilyticus]MCF2568639.1 hypothetical protein [Mediterraneibacter glycyrrhizinilyticus]